MLARIEITRRKLYAVNKFLWNFEEGSKRAFAFLFQDSSASKCKMYCFWGIDIFVVSNFLADGSDVISPILHVTTRPFKNWTASFETGLHLINYQRGSSARFPVLGHMTSDDWSRLEFWIMRARWLCNSVGDRPLAASKPWRLYLIPKKPLYLKEQHYGAHYIEGIEESFPIEYDLYKCLAPAVALISLVPLSGVLLPKLMKLHGNFERRFNAALVEIYGVGV